MKQKLFGRQRSYMIVFDEKSPMVNEVLKDLAAFCRADESTFHVDPRAHALMEGRREVWLRIQDHLKLDPDAIWKKYGRNQ